MEKMAISWLFVLLIYVLPVIVFIVIFTACMAPIFGMIRGRKEVPPAVVSPDSARRHIALICLIRGGEALIVVPLFLLIMLIGFGYLLGEEQFLWRQAHGHPSSRLWLFC